MKEGYWGNYETGNLFLIDEHELWLRRANNSDKLGINQVIQAKFKNYVIGADRTRFLSFIFANAPVMRFRGHGHFVTCEYNCKDEIKPHALIQKWGKENAGALLGLFIFNFFDNKTIQTNWEKIEKTNTEL